jgi:hypothetical protein
MAARTLDGRSTAGQRTGARAALTANASANPADPLNWAAIAEEQRLAGVPEFQPGYDPADPLNWKGIDAEKQAQRDAVGTPGSDWYDNPENDPEYLAWLEQYNYNYENTNKDSKLRQDTANADYAEALAELDRQSATGGRNIDLNLLERGVLNSGEFTTDHGELVDAMTLARGKADTTLASTTGDIESDRLRALQQLDFDREQQIVASRARIAAAEQLALDQAGSGGGGGGTATYNPIDTSVEAQPKAALPYQAREEVDRGTDSINYSPSKPASNPHAPAESVGPKPASSKPRANTGRALTPRAGIGQRVAY